ncbi:unnamed protein product [Caenorhabditis brenneri]
MTETGLRYPSLRVVLQHLEANKRIELVRRCPSLKFVDKATPFKMNYLYLGAQLAYINSCSYNIGIIRELSNDSPKEISDYHRFNEKGGTRWDLDEFGKADRSLDQIINPGDIKVETAHTPYVRRTVEEEDIRMEGLKRRLATLKASRRMKQRQAEIARIEAWLYEWELRKANRPAPYKMYLKFICKKANGSETVEFLEYNKKLYEASKHMFNVLFGGRRHPLCVKDLKITTVDYVLRLPEMLNIKARVLLTGYNFESILSSFENILVDQKFEGVDIYEGNRLSPKYDHPAIKSANEFRILGAKITEDLFDIILNDEHPKLTVSKGKLTKEMYSTLLDKMIQDKRPIGTCYQFGVHSKKLVKTVLNEWKQREGVTLVKGVNGSKRFPFFHDFNITDSSMITVYCKRNTNYNEKMRTSEPWMLFIHVFKRTNNQTTLKLTKDTYLKHMAEMITPKRSVGTMSGYRIHSKELAKDILSEIRTREGVTMEKKQRMGCTRFPYTYYLPLDDSRRLAIFCTRHKIVSKKICKVYSWIIWFHVERSSNKTEITEKEYHKFLNIVIENTKVIGEHQLIEVKTKHLVAKLLNGIRNWKGMSFEKQNRGCSAFPNTYSYPIDNSTQLVIFCEKNKNYNEKDASSKPWFLWHCVEIRPRGKAIKS